MNELEFLKKAYLLLRSLPVCDVLVSFSQDVSNIELSAKLSGSLSAQHFKKLADSDLIVTLDSKNFSLTINHPDYIPF